MTKYLLSMRITLALCKILITVQSIWGCFQNIVQKVHNIIQRFRESGTISVRKGQGRKTVLDARDLRALRRHCITYRNATVMEITTWAQEYFQKTLSVNTIHCAIRRCRLKLYRSKKKPYLNMIQKRRHFLWAKVHLKWTVAKWKTVLWSDGSKFEVLFGKLGRHVIRTKEDKDNPSCYQRSVQKPASLMVPAILNKNFGAVVLHAGTNDIRLRQTEILKKDFRNLVEKVRTTSPTTRIIVSGPLPTFQRGIERWGNRCGRLRGRKNSTKGAEFSVMSSPESATPVPPPAKKQTVWIMEETAF
ncbi:hypothetical protein QTP70_008202 [Hemibagrus guttatus]|uniref:Transposase Tc1-like domain-containing protein n=1 Tax=Hemibagrus guttatus TaxID=175788 RepID=A0AAE0QGZ0_9TELE|nr:hypothetical protein QTP70_008202 [Hemibagrus guttatus]